MLSATVVCHDKLLSLLWTETDAEIYPRGERGNVSADRQGA